MNRPLLALSSLLACFAALAPGPVGAQSAERKVLHLPMRSAGPGTLDPVSGSTTYDNRASSLFYEPLLQYKYLKRPLELEPLLLEEMPQSEDGITWRFRLKPGVRFHDDPAFPGGRGREVTADDVFYSWKRLADPAYELENWWLFEDTIAGFNDFKDEQTKRVAAGEEFDYDAQVEGFRKIDDHTFDVVLKQPIYRFMWLLAMFQTSIVPHEAVERYGEEFSRRPVGTGPFLLEEWVQNKSLTAVRNPNYHEQTFPEEWMPEDEELGLTAGAGKKLPLADRVEITMFVQENPMWLEFKSGNLDYTQVPAENFLEAFHKRSRKLKKDFREQGIVAHAVPLLDFIFRGFNMEDQVLGGYDEKSLALRKAFSYAVDLEEFNDVFYNGTNIVYDGMIPPGLDGFPEDGDGPISFRGPDLEKARELMARAGYPGGRGLPAIDYYVSSSGNLPEQAELLKRQLNEIGVDLNVTILHFPQLIETVNNKKAPFFAFAWSSDYPDGENNLALFYGPNEAPGSNHYNYKNPEFDALYEKIRTMEPSQERTQLYEKMRDMVVEDVPFIGSMARTRFYLVQPWLKNFKPEETFYNWVKYLDVDSEQRP